MRQLSSSNLRTRNTEWAAIPVICFSKSILCCEKVETLLMAATLLIPTMVFIPLQLLAIPFEKSNNDLLFSEGFNLIRSSFEITCNQVPRRWFMSHAIMHWFKQCLKEEKSQIWQTEREWLYWWLQPWGDETEKGNGANWLAGNSREENCSTWRCWKVAKCPKGLHQ